jgi:hypothetical protein
VTVEARQGGGGWSDGGGSVASSSALHGNRAPVGTKSSSIGTNFTVEDLERGIGHEKISPRLESALGF